MRCGFHQRGLRGWSHLRTLRLDNISQQIPACLTLGILRHQPTTPLLRSRLTIFDGGVVVTARELLSHVGWMVVPVALVVG